jgi:hypothetical protein
MTTRLKDGRLLSMQGLTRVDQPPERRQETNSLTPLRANTTSRADSPEAVLFMMPVTKALSSGAASAQDMSPIPTATPGGG